MRSWTGTGTGAGAELESFDHCSVHASEVAGESIVRACSMQQHTPYRETLSALEFTSVCLEIIVMERDAQGSRSGWAWTRLRP